MSAPPIAQGDLYWIPAEALRPSVPGEPHPYLVLQEDVLNRSRIPTLVVCGLSSQLRRAGEPGNVLLEPEEGGLPRRSVVVVSQVCVVEKADLGPRIGCLSPARVTQVLDGLRFQQRFAERPRAS
ncbi:MAG: type II toxin-antitoxin system PemK/MazF family toxin [Alphaproteobacteria bacterium]|nr:type II toxin-antitoxin system PemK/MazF family toxin [Alphaproteobacteria bacterium]